MVRFVSEVMTKDIVGVDKDAPIKDAAGRMLERRISCLAVRDREGITGIVTDRDFVRMAWMKETPGVVKEIMTPNPLAVSPKATFAEAAELMGRRRMRHLLVKNGGEILGIISLRDLLQTEPTTIYSYLIPMLSVKDTELLVNFVKYRRR